MVDLTKFYSGDFERDYAYGDSRVMFLDAMASHGYGSLPVVLKVGQFGKIDSPLDNRKGKGSAWYIYNEVDVDGSVLGFGTYGCWKSGDRFVWCSKKVAGMNFRERAQYNVEREAMRQREEELEKLRHAEAAAECQAIYEGASDALEHGYYIKKGIKPVVGVRLDGKGRLIVPVLNEDGHIMSLQRIDKNGGKYFYGGGRSKGGYFVIEGDASLVMVTEGLATGQSVHEATNATVYVAFNAGNLYPVCSVVAKRFGNTAKITVCADNDENTAGNPGVTKGAQAATAHGFDIVYPDTHGDWNDIHNQHGLDFIKSKLVKTVQAYEKKKVVESDTPKPLGFMADVINYYNATAGIDQPGFAVQTALAVASVVCGRWYKTSYENYTSLYLLNVGKSSTGKEHAKTVVERILYAAGQDALIAGDGYTSAGAVFTALLNKPRHITVIDELGRYLEAGKTGGVSNQREANTKLMESITRAHSVLRPPTYSTMSAGKNQDLNTGRVIHNPCVTMLAMTTPVTLFDSLDAKAIKDGFIGRFIISMSNVDRQVRIHKPALEVPPAIVQWIDAINKRAGSNNETASEPTKPQVLELTSGAHDMQVDFQKFCMDQCNKLEAFGMEELPSKSNEMALRVALIHALSRDPQATSVETPDMDFAIAYVKKCLMETIAALKLSISSSDYEAAKKEILIDLRNRGQNGITWASMQKNAPYSKHKQKDLKDILNALKDAELAIDELYQPPQRGRPTTRWIAIK